MWFQSHSFSDARSGSVQTTVLSHLLVAIVTASEGSSTVCVCVTSHRWDRRQHTRLCISNGAHCSAVALALMLRGGTSKPISVFNAVHTHTHLFSRASACYRAAVFCRLGQQLMLRSSDTRPLCCWADTHSQSHTHTHIMHRSPNLRCNTHRLIYVPSLPPSPPPPPSHCRTLSLLALLSAAQG